MLLMDRPVVPVDAAAPLSLEQYLGLPEEARCEIVDGVLRPMVRPNKLHREVQSQLAQILRVGKPRDVRVAEEEVVVFHTAPPHARIPDVVVFRAGADPKGLTNFTAAADVLLAVEVVSEGTQTADRYEKPAEYARNGIPSFWRIELEPFAVWVYQLEAGVYRDFGPYRRGGLVKDPNLDWISVEVDDLLGDYA